MQMNTAHISFLLLSISNIEMKLKKLFGIDLEALSSNYLNLKTMTMEKNQTMENKSVTEKKKHIAAKLFIYGGVAALAMYGVGRIPFVRNMALPFLMTAATKYWNSLGTPVPKA